MLDRRSIHLPLHLTALLLTAATFPLIFMGGLVTSHGAGMAVPDWPNSYGYNMFLFPPSQWIGGIWYEHVHRLWGSAVGFIAIVLVMQAWGPGGDPRRRRWMGLGACGSAALALAATVRLAMHVLRSPGDQAVATGLQHTAVGLTAVAMILATAWCSRRREPRRWVRWLCVGVLVAVCVQGLLGGLRVTEVNRTLAVIHGCFAHVFFCLSAFTALATSRWWMRAADLSGSNRGPAGRRLSAVGAACLLAILLQLILGAVMRHHGAGLAIPDLPLAYGKLLPPMDAASLTQVNEYRAWRLHEKPVTLGQVWIHFAHRVGSIVVAGMLAVLVVRAWRMGQPGLKWAAGATATLVIVQFTLGVLTVHQKKPADIASLHVAGGALLMMSAAVLTASALRLYSSRCRSVAPVAAPEFKPGRQLMSAGI